jgi:hypothetical protein
MNKIILNMIDLAMKVTSSHFRIEDAPSDGTISPEKTKILSSSPDTNLMIGSLSKHEIITLIKELSITDALELIQKLTPEARMKVMDALDKLPDLKAALQLCSNEKLVVAGLQRGLKVRLSPLTSQPDSRIPNQKC